jgi:DNA-binding NarL/FixJ family response regulator
MSEALLLSGLSHAAAHLYREAAISPDETLEFLAQSCRLTPDLTSSAHQELLESGLLVEGIPGVRVLPPAEAAQMLVSRHEMELNQQEKRLAACRAQAEYFKSLTSSTSAREQEIVTGAVAIQNLLRSLSEASETEIDTLVPGGRLDASTIASAQETNAEAYGRGVKARTVYLSIARKDPKTVQHLHWLAENGAQVRTLPKLPVRMLISDRKTALLPLNLQNAMDGVVIYRNQVLVKALLELFESIWQIAQPLGPQSPKHLQGMGDFERTIMEMVVQGKNDVEIGKKLAINERTVRRKMEEAMKTFGVGTRYELIYLAAKKDLI